MSTKGSRVRQRESGPRETPRVDEHLQVAPGESLVRINAQITPALHKRVKAGCAAEGISITQMLIEVLEARFPTR